MELWFGKWFQQNKRGINLRTKEGQKEQKKKNQATKQQRIKQNKTKTNK